MINIIKFYDVYVVVEPKRRALNAANDELQAARDKLAYLTDQIRVNDHDFCPLHRRVTIMMICFEFHYYYRVALQMLVCFTRY